VREKKEKRMRDLREKQKGEMRARYGE